MYMKTVPIVYIKNRLEIIFKIGENCIRKSRYPFSTVWRLIMVYGYARCSTNEMRQYPIDTFPGPLRVLFSVIAPFAMTLHVPGAVILGKPLFGWPE
ncbi:MAG: ABC-2 family transporter protein, partial [Lachnospiraceae bacterium]|nr:ABC-2 family transporter protein [Lachnospiraceae bacterium]